MVDEGWKAKAESEGFTYWPGGDEAPADWDGSNCIILRSGLKFGAVTNDWRHKYGEGDIIGYRKKSAMDRIQDEWARELEKLNIGVIPISEAIDKLAKMDLPPATRATYTVTRKIGDIEVTITGPDLDKIMEHVQ